MKRYFINVVFLFSVLTINADKNKIDLRELGNIPNRNEVPATPEVNYDDESNSVEVAVEAASILTMRVIDIYGTTVFSCPVLMVDGTPTNYQLPELPAGIYTLKVESDDVTYEGTLVIE